MFHLRSLLRTSPAVRQLPISHRFLSATNASAFKSLTEADIAHFAEILPKTSILSSLPPIHTSPSDFEVYNNDWMGKYNGSSQCVLKPNTAQEVSNILRWCNEHNIAVVPQGGNTGLVGVYIALGPDVSLLHQVPMNNI